jgi:mannose-6-phosphate isomerase
MRLRGKTEMWYAISAQPGAEVMVGVRAGVTREAFRQAIGDGTVENCLEHFVLHAGDAVFVPAGTAHTIGPGLVLCEIQEYSDLTYRVFDYNRLTAEGKPRPLHVEKALEVIEFGKQCGGKVTPVNLRGDAVNETHYVACRYFATERWEFQRRMERQTYSEHFELLIILAGRGRIEARGETQEFAQAQTWLLPATLGEYKLEAAGPMTLLRTYVPKLDEVASRMRQRGVPEDAVARLVQQ